MSRGLGYIADDKSLVRAPFRRLAARLGLGGTRPPAHSIAGLPPVFDQGGTGSCTGHAVAAALSVYLGWIPSPDEIYRNGRAIDRIDPKQRLTDNGAQPDQVFRAINQFGVRNLGMTAPDGRFSDVDPATINNEPKLGDLEQESTTVLVGDYAITSFGQQRCDEVRAALALDKPVTVAIAGGSSVFQSYSGGILPVLNAPLDHYVVLTGYYTLSDGRHIFGGRNSWSTTWGELGDFWLSEDGLQELGDMVVVDMNGAN